MLYLTSPWLINFMTLFTHPHLPLATTNVFSVPRSCVWGLSLLGSTYKWNYYMCVPFSDFLLSMMPWRSIHVVKNGRFLFFFSLSFHIPLVIADLLFTFQKPFPSLVRTHTLDILSVSLGNQHTYYHDVQPVVQNK